MGGYGKGVEVEKKRRGLFDGGEGGQGGRRNRFPRSTVNAKLPFPLSEPAQSSSSFCMHTIETSPSWRQRSAAVVDVLYYYNGKMTGYQGRKCYYRFDVPLVR